MEYNKYNIAASVQFASMIAGEMIVNYWCYWDQRRTAQFSIGNSQIMPENICGSESLLPINDSCFTWLRSFPIPLATAFLCF